MPFVPITGPIVADTVYANNALVAKDVGATFPEVTPITADLQVDGHPVFACLATARGYGVGHHQDRH